jgi:hypothetical protein
MYWGLRLELVDSLFHLASWSKAFLHFACFKACSFEQYLSFLENSFPSKFCSIHYLKSTFTFEKSNNPNLFYNSLLPNRRFEEKI